MMVVALVMILSTMAVSGYVTYRRSVVVDLSADNLVSQIDELRARTVYGKLGNEREQDILAALAEGEEFLGDRDVSALCYGVLFDKQEGEFVVKGFSQPFSSRKVWRNELGGFGFVGCGDAPEVEEGYDLELDEGVIITGEDVDDFFLRFVPPNGMMENDLRDEVQLQIEYRGVNDGLSRTLSVDPINEKISIQ